MTEKTEMQRTIKPFALAAILWAVVGIVVCRYFSNSSELQNNLVWLFGLWALCLVDLLALGKTVQGTLALVGGDAENRAARAIHTFSWGLIKLVCLGIFVLVMMKGKPFPLVGLLAGTATLLVVPLMGGFLWARAALSGGVSA